MPPIVMGTKSPKELVAADALPLLTPTKESDTVKAAVAYVLEGDHWRKGDGWIGPFSENIRAGDAVATALVRNEFVANGALAEGADRHAQGVVGHEPDFGLTVKREVTEDAPLTQAETDLIAEAGALVVEWWDDHDHLMLLREWVDTLLTRNRAVLRVFVPRGVRQLDPVTNTQMVPVPGGEDEAMRMRKALNYIYPTLAPPGSAVVLTDPDTMQPYALFNYERDGRTFTEVMYVEEGDDGTPDTVLRLLEGAGDRKRSPKPQEYRFKWGGYLPVHEMSRRPFITAPAVSQQRKLDLAETMEARNVITGGAAERWVLNASPPGEKEFYEENGIQKERFVPGTIRIGAGITNWVTGIETPIIDPATGLQKGVSLTSPTVMRMDPASVDTFRVVAQAAYATILSHLHQRHILMQGDGSASAVSRVQMRADYANSLLLTKAAVDAALRWLIETILAMGSQFAGMPDRYKSLRAVGACKIDTGPLTPEERRIVLEEMEKGTLSRETAIAMLGNTEDVDNELNRIRAEEEQSLSTQQRRAEVVGTLVQQGGATLEAAAEVAGYSDEQQTVLKKRDPEPVPSAVPPGLGPVPAVAPPTKTEEEVE